MLGGELLDEGKVWSLNEFLEDRKFVTYKQKETYLSNSRELTTIQRKSIQKSFERYYESFEWIRKKKGKPLQFKLGNLRSMPINNDGRSFSKVSKQSLSLINEISKFIYSLKDLDNQVIRERYYFFDHDGNLALTPLNWLVESGLVPKKYKNFSQSHYSLREGESLEYWIAKHYTTVKSKLLREEFRKIENKLPFRKLPVLVYEKKSMLMDENDYLKLKEFQEILLEDPNCEKPRPFHAANVKTKLYNRKLGDYLNDKFETKKIYYVYQVNVSDFVYDFHKDEHKLDFIRYIKDKSDTNIIKKEFKEFAKYRSKQDILNILTFEDSGYIERDMRKINNSPVQYALAERMMLKEFLRLDLELGFGRMSQDNINLYKEKEFTLYKVIDRYKEELLEQLKIIKEVQSDYEKLFL